MKNKYGWCASSTVVKIANDSGYTWDLIVDAYQEGNTAIEESIRGAIRDIKTMGETQESHTALRNLLAGDYGYVKSDHGYNFCDTCTYSSNVRNTHGANYDEMFAYRFSITAFRIPNSTYRIITTETTR